MPAPLHIHLSTRQRRRLCELRHDPTLKPRERNRVEMYLLSDQGLTVPRLAPHFGYREATLRRWIRPWEAKGLKAIRHMMRGPGPDGARRKQVRRVLSGLLRRKRIWTVAQLAEARAEKGLVMQPRTVRKYRYLMGVQYRRTKYTLPQKQDPARVAAVWEELATLKQQTLDGEIPLFFLDACGFSLTMPLTYTGCHRGQLPPVAYESPQGQRVNVLAARAAPGNPVANPLVWWAADFTYRSHHLLVFLRGMCPPCADGTRRVVVLDNASLHRSRAIQEAQPERNDIERTFRDAKHQALTVCTYPTVQRLADAIHQGFCQLRQQTRSQYLAMTGA